MKNIQIKVKDNQAGRIAAEAFELQFKNGAKLKALKGASDAVRGFSSSIFIGVDLASAPDYWVMFKCDLRSGHIMILEQGRNEK
jgi:hypothetical protein